MSVGLPRDAELLWGSHQRPVRGPKPALRLDRIIDTAIEIADTEGLAALSMQRLATKLGSGTMSLYRYVRSKDELVSLMLDTAIGRPSMPDADADGDAEADGGRDGDAEAEGWRASLERWAHRNRDIYRRHPWTLALVTSPRMMGPNETATFEAALYALSGTGLRPTEMLHTVVLVNGYVRGVTQPVVDRADGERDSVTPQFASLSPEILKRFDKQDRYPTLTAVMNGEICDESVDLSADAGFVFGLDRILDGIEAFISARRPPRGP